MSEHGSDGPRRRSRRSRRGGRRRRRGGPGDSFAAAVLARAEQFDPEAADAPAVAAPAEPAAKKRVRRAKAPAVVYPPASREIEATADDAARRIGIEQLRPEQEQVVADVLA